MDLVGDFELQTEFFSTRFMAQAEVWGFCSAKQIFVANFRYTTWARILSDHNIFCTQSEGRENNGGILLLIFSCYCLFFSS